VHLVGFTMRNLSRCTVTWTSNFSETNYIHHVYDHVATKQDHMSS